MRLWLHNNLSSIAALDISCDRLSGRHANVRSHVIEIATIVQRFVRPDLNIGCFIPPLDAEEAAESWERWIKTFVRKTRFFRVSTLQDKLDALSIYGGEEL